MISRRFKLEPEQFSPEVSVKHYHASSEDTIKTFPTMLKLICGTLVGGVKYSDIYINSDEDEETSSANGYVNNNDKGHDKNKTQHKIPPLPQIA